jgi:hypothetical protein
MYKYKLWIKLNETQVLDADILADSDYQAKLLAEAKYGIGNVLGFAKLDENNEYRSVHT